MTNAIRPAIDLPSALLALTEALRQTSLPELLTASQAARALKIDVKTLRAAVRARQIHFVLIGRRKKFTPADILAYIDSQRDKPPCPSINRSAPRTTSMTSGSKVIGITELRARRIAKKQKR
jgi:hypothetical protein